jgi:hypothetical protein
MVVYKVKDLTDMSFGKLTVLHRAESYISPKGSTSTMWACQCACGKTVVTRGSRLKMGTAKSCGCDRALTVISKREKGIKRVNTHGLTDTKIYTIWSAMKRRCLNPNACNYKNYGGRGIEVCEEWIHDFKSFYDWSMINGYAQNLSIDRIDTNQGYSPLNCRWITLIEQASNKRSNRYITYNEITETLAGWSRITGIDSRVLGSRLKKGYEPKEILKEWINKVAS